VTSLIGAGTHNVAMTKHREPIDELINAHVWLCRQRQKRRRARQQRDEPKAAAPVPTASFTAKTRDENAPLK
jgi:hypothetical protein